MIARPDRRTDFGFRGRLIWLLTMALFLAACGGAARTTQGEDHERSQSTQRTPAGAAAAAAPASPSATLDGPECDVRCCSPATLAQQRETSARTGDPSIAGECCFCDE